MTAMVALPLIAVAATAQVNIQGSTFVPANTRVNIGDTVRWTNLDASAHSATSNAGLWDSGVLAQGRSFSFTFSLPGVFDYRCSLHPFMTGRVTVLAAITPAPTAAPPTPAPPTAAPPTAVPATPTPRPVTAPPAAPTAPPAATAAPTPAPTAGPTPAPTPAATPTAAPSASPPVALATTPTAPPAAGAQAAEPRSEGIPVTLVAVAVAIVLAGAVAAFWIARARTGRA